MVVLFFYMPFLAKEIFGKKLKSVTSAMTNFRDLSPGTNVHAYAYFCHICRQMPLHLFEYSHKY